MDRLLRQRGGMPHIFSHQVRPGHLDELAACEHADGFQIAGHDPCHSCLSRSGIPSKNHMHGGRIRFKSLFLPKLLHFEIIFQRQDIFFDGLKPHNFRKLLLDGLYSSLRGLGGKNSYSERKSFFFTGKHQLPIFHYNLSRSTLHLLFQFILAEGTVKSIRVFFHGSYPPVGTIKCCKSFSRRRVISKSKTQLFFRPFAKQFQHPPSDLPQAVLGKFPCLANIVQRRKKGGSKIVCQLIQGTVCEQEQIFSRRRQGRNRTRYQSRTNLHQHSLLLRITPSQRDTSRAKQLRQHGKNRCTAFFILFKKDC